MGHGCLVCQHTEILGEVGFRREVGWHLERLVGHLYRQHTVEGIGGDMMTCEHEQIPTLLAESQRIGFNVLLIGFPIKTLISHLDTAVQFHRLDQHGQVILSHRHIFKDDTIFHRHTVGENRTDGKRREEPALYRIILEHLGIGDVILVAIHLIALDDQSDDIQDGIAMAVERGTLQGITIRHLVLNPFLVEFLEGDAPVSPNGGDEPHVLLKDL